MENDSKNRWKSNNWSQKDTPNDTSTLLCSIGQICTTLYSTVPYFSVLYSTEHSCTLLCSTVRFRVALYSTAGYCAALKSFVYYCSAQYSTVQPCTVQHGSDSPVLYSAVQNSSVLFSSVLFFVGSLVCDFLGVFFLSIFGAVLFVFHFSGLKFRFQGLNSDFRA